MKGLLIAIQFLTRLPTPPVVADGDDFARSMRWFPMVGLLIGAIVATGAWVGGQVDAWTGALVALLCWVGVTGALHLDGLGDVADACGALHKGRERLRAVLADPHVGSFAVVTIGLQLIAKLIWLHGLVEANAFLPLVAIPFAARIGPLLWACTLPPLHDGLAARFGGAVRMEHVAIWLALLLLASWWVPGLIVAPVLMLLWSRWLRRTLGGVSGDGHGAGIELMETGLLLAVLIVEHVA